MSTKKPDDRDDQDDQDDPGDREDLIHEAVVPALLAGGRLDAVLAKLMSDYSRSRLLQWIEQGRVQVNGVVILKGREPVAEGAQLQLRAQQDAEPGRVLPQKLPLDLAWQDEHLAIVRKPAGLTVHPGAGQKDGTLQNALLHHFPQTAGVPRSGIVHRLDKDTSGLLLVALSLPAHAKLVRAMARREIRREYDAVVQGTYIAGGSINLPLGRHPQNRLKQAVLDRGGREAVTHYRVQERFAHHTHLRVKLETGRTHQIRVHFSHLRHPIAGDSLYGGDTPRGAGISKTLRAALAAFPRQALHARELELVHPITSKPLLTTWEPPKDIQKLLGLLREHDAV